MYYFKFHYIYRARPSEQHRERKRKIADYTEEIAANASSRTADAERTSTAAASKAVHRARVLLCPLRRPGFDRLQQIHQGGRRALHQQEVSLGPAATS